MKKKKKAHQPWQKFFSFEVRTDWNCLAEHFASCTCKQIQCEKKHDTTACLSSLFFPRHCNDLRLRGGKKALFYYLFHLFSLFLPDNLKRLPLELIWDSSLDDEFACRSAASVAALRLGTFRCTLKGTKNKKCISICPSFPVSAFPAVSIDEYLEQYQNAVEDQSCCLLR